jgi:D-galactarolactone cycloisomerase
MTAIEPVAIEAFAFRVPIESPLRVSFGVMKDRPAVLVRAIDADGTEGWGEAWCNWPSVAAEHRARLVNEVVAPHILGKHVERPGTAYETMSAALEVLAIQTAEYGPIAQAIAGIDIALWDLAARKAGLPLYRLLAGDRNRVVERVPAYASGLNPGKPEIVAATEQAKGHRAFKLKIGFERALDVRNLAALRETLGPDAAIMVDVNQGYDLATAKAMAREIAPFAPNWYEEPIRADQPLAAWRELADASPVRLAAGENLRGAEFDTVIAAKVLGVVQPDVAKWGGITGNLAVARKATAAGALYCPHWLASGVGLLASLHILAAIDGGGTLELDSNPNPLRDLLGGNLDIRDGKAAVPQGPGLGVTPDLAALERYRSWPPR